MQGANRSVSIVVLCYNEALHIKACLQSLLQMEGQNYIAEIIVVDNGSTDGSAQIIEEFCNEKLRLETIQPMSVGAARRWAVTQAQSSLLAFVDGDCKVPQHWLSQHLENWRRVATVGKIGGVGGPNGLSPQNSFGRSVEAMKKSPFGHGFSPQAWVTDGQREVDHLPTTNALFDRKALIHSGNFNDGNVGEDVQMGFKLNLLGFRQFLFSTPWVQNQCAENWGQWCQRMFRFGEAQGYQFFVHRFPFWGGLAFSVFALSWMLWPQFFWIYLLALATETMRVTHVRGQIFDQVFRGFLMTHICYAAGVTHGLVCRAKDLLSAYAHKSMKARRPLIVEK